MVRSCSGLMFWSCKDFPPALQGQGVAGSTSSRTCQSRMQKDWQLTHANLVWARRNYYAQIRVWVNERDPARSDAVVFFSNISPVIPAGPNGCAVASPAAAGGVLQLSKDACGDGTGLQDVSTAVVKRMADIWNITGDY